MDRSADLPTLASERLTLRPTRDDDVEPLAAILGEPEVERWWGRYDSERVRADLAQEACWTIVSGDRVAGWMQVNEERSDDYRQVAFDIALGAGARGRGLGADALRLAIRHFVAEGHHRFTIDPALDNERAIRSYAAVGFKPVGVLRACERGPDGVWRDGLLMDLLAEELSDAR